MEQFSKLEHVIMDKEEKFNETRQGQFEIKGMDVAALQDGDYGHNSNDKPKTQSVYSKAINAVKHFCFSAFATATLLGAFGGGTYLFISADEHYHPRCTLSDSMDSSRCEGKERETINGTVIAAVPDEDFIGKDGYVYLTIKYDNNALEGFSVRTETDVNYVATSIHGKKVKGNMMKDFGMPANRGLLHFNDYTLLNFGNPYVNFSVEEGLEK